MDNIYDIRRDKQLQFILSTEYTHFFPKKEVMQSCAVVVNLYYEDKVEFYFSYLNHVPKEITLYIFSSKETVLQKAEKYSNHENTLFIKKENRGRDLSAFLVAFRPYMDKYEKICFVHDKKEHHIWQKSDINKWEENLWGNMLATQDYIHNVLYLFESRPEIGILFPPEPLGKYVEARYLAKWNGNIDNCLKLAQKMNLSTDINREKRCISLGSVFWTQREAIKKLVDLGWNYEDFPEEPMPDDCTVSHAIERILGYVAQDAGYDAATIMTEQYASWSLLFLQDYFWPMFFKLSDEMGINNLDQFYMLNIQKGRVLNYIEKYPVFYLYGAGKYGRALLKILREERIEPSGFVVTDGSKEPQYIDGLRVYELKDIKKQSVGIILTVYYPLQKIMINALKENEIYDYIVLFGVRNDNY